MSAVGGGGRHQHTCWHVCVLDSEMESYCVQKEGLKLEHFGVIIFIKDVFFFQNETIIAEEDGTSKQVCFKQTRLGTASWPLQCSHKS